MTIFLTEPIKFISSVKVLPVIKRKREDIKLSNFRVGGIYCSWKLSISFLLFNELSTFFHFSFFFYNIHIFFSCKLSSSLFRSQSFHNLHLWKMET